MLRLGWLWGCRTEWVWEDGAVLPHSLLQLGRQLEVHRMGRGVCAALHGWLNVVCGVASFVRGGAGLIGLLWDGCAVDTAILLLHLGSNSVW